jgi:hypothetical protein
MSSNKTKTVSKKDVTKANIIPKKSKRDARYSSNGFLYQRGYCVYYLLNDDKIKNIIEEGTVEGKDYEDITIVYNDDVIKTYQIKYHTYKNDNLTISNDIFKTIGHENNFDLNEIYYIISSNSNGNTNCSDNLLKWKDKKINEKDVYELIMKLKDNMDGNTDDTPYGKTIRLFEKKGENESVKYLKKYIIDDGLNYKQLKSETDKLIYKTFSVNDKMVITYIRLILNEIFTDNSFGSNTILSKELLINNIKKKFPSNNFKILDKSNMFYDLYKNILQSAQKKPIHMYSF